MEPIRNIKIFGNYFWEFYNAQPVRVQHKIEWTFKLIKTLPKIPVIYFKHIEGVKSLYEIRVEIDGSTFRIFSFFDKDKLVVIGNGFQKKTPKTPKKEIDRAIKIMKEYYEKGE